MPKATSTLPSCAAGAQSTATVTSVVPSAPTGASLLSAVDPGKEPPLTMEEAARLSVVDQPLLTGRQAKIQAEEQQAVAAAQLPNPQLTGGLMELPINTPEAFSARSRELPPERRIFEVNEKADSGRIFLNSNLTGSYLIIRSQGVA